MSFRLSIEPHQERWMHDFREEAAQLRAAFGSAIRALHHIGSTAIPGIWAKPIIDILGEADSLQAIDVRSDRVEQLGYEAMGEFGIPGRRYFRKSAADGRRTHHLHVFLSGSPGVLRHLAFRDFLRAHPEEAQAYSDMKRRLCTECAGNMDAYIDGKDAFVKEVERRALEWHAASSPG